MILSILVIRRRNVGFSQKTMFSEFRFLKFMLHVFPRDALWWTSHKLLVPPIKLIKTEIPQN